MNFYLMCLKSKEEMFTIKKCLPLIFLSILQVLMLVHCILMTAISFFQAIPVEIRVENDTIDLEIRIREGKQARISKVNVKGNTKTNDQVVVRELRSRPGQLFNRSNIIRTTRELAQLRYFDAETIKPDIQPNPADGTVDIIYEVEETSADQIELSGGWDMVGYWAP